MASTNVLHVDATYKLNTCGFPVVVVGVSDLWHQFHPVAFFLVSGARQARLEPTLISLFDLYRVVTRQSVAVKYVMTDADHAQRNGLEAVIKDFGIGDQPTYLMCLYHVMANVKMYTAGMTTASRQLAYRHVYRIHYARSEVDLTARVTDALEAWDLDSSCAVFKERFANQWLAGRFTNWFCLASPPGHAKTNNPVEQFNRAFKREYTTRTLVSVNMLLGHLFAATRHYNVRAKPFQLTVIAAPDQAKRYKELLTEDRLRVVSMYRSTVAFLVNDAQQPRLLRHPEGQ